MAQCDGSMRGLCGNTFRAYSVGQAEGGLRKLQVGAAQQHERSRAWGGRPGQGGRALLCFPGREVLPAFLCQLVSRASQSHNFSPASSLEEAR